MNCEEALLLISGYLDGRNTEEEMTLLREHLEICPDCRQLLQTFEEIDLGVASLEAEPPADLKASIMEAVRSEEKPKRTYRRWVTTAVAAALVLVIGIGAIKLDTVQQTGTPMAASADMAVPAAYSRSMNEKQSADTAALDTQTVADCIQAPVVETRELLPEMEICPCETLEDGSLLYQLSDADAAELLSEAYGLELFVPANSSASEVSYARLLP